jgi:Tol biopolymer transport system component
MTSALFRFYARRSCRVALLSLAASLALAHLVVGMAAASAQDSDASSSIVVMDANGDNLRTLYTRAGYWSGTPSFSPDGKKLLFDSCPVGSFGETHIYSLTATFNDQPGEPTDLGPGYAPAWSPGGKQIAFYIQAGNPERLAPGVWTMNADGSDRTWRCGGKAPRWSPDGTSLAVVRITGSGDTIDVHNLTTQETKTVLEHPYPRLAGAAWSPDGTRLAVLVPSREGDGELLLITAGFNGHKTNVRYKGDIGWRPWWSPDGKQLLLWIRDKEQHRRVHVLDLDATSEPQLLKHQEETAFNSDANWSPDGKQIVWVRAE